MQSVHIVYIENVQMTAPQSGAKCYLTAINTWWIWAKNLLQYKLAKFVETQLPHRTPCNFIVSK
jgi:hypothetical protein